MAVTLITHHVLRDDTAAREWDAAMYERLSAAGSQPGWIGGQLLRAATRGRPGTAKMRSGRLASGSMDCSRALQRQPGMR